MEWSDFLLWNARSNSNNTDNLRNLFDHKDKSESMTAKLNEYQLDIAYLIVSYYWIKGFSYISVNIDLNTKLNLSYTKIYKLN